MDLYIIVYNIGDFKMALNWAPTYPDGTLIIVSDEQYKDSWLMDRFSAEKLLDKPYLIKTMSARMCHLWLEAYNRKSILPKAHKSDPSVSIAETKVLIRERMSLLSKTKTAYNVTRKRRILLSQYCDELNNLAARVCAQPANKQLELDVHGSKNRNTLYDFSDTLTGLYSEAAYETKQRNPGAKLTHEHFFPRTAFATWLAEHVVEERLKDESYRLTENEMLPSVYAASFCSITTPLENQNLIKYQGTSVFESPADAYRKAGIRMVITDDVKVHYSWTNLAEIFECELPLPNVSDFDTDGNGLFVEPSSVGAPILSVVV